MIILMYIGAILAANILTAFLPPIVIGCFIVAAGTVLIGLTFVLRDLVQEKYGRATAYKVIGIALTLSTAFTIINGDMMAIVVASALAFLLSESTDTEIYTRLRLPPQWRVFWSGTVGGVLDSFVFILIGLSPLTTGFITWEQFWYSVAGQVMVKTMMQVVGFQIISRLGIYARTI